MRLPLLCGLALGLFVSGTASAAPLNVIADLGLYNTGVDNAGVALVDPAPPFDPPGVDPGVIDSHWIATLSPDPNNPAPPDVQVRAWRFLPAPPWIAETTISRWVSAGKKGDGTTDAVGGDYVYRTSFNIGASIDPATLIVTGQWAADDIGYGASLFNIEVNGTANAQILDVGFGAFEAFELNTGFVAGVNTIDFHVLNGGDAINPNPHGLHVQFLTADATVTAPAAMADFNDDTRVDGADLSKWKNDFGPGAGSDADGDGDSDGADFLVWQREFGLGVSPPAVAAIPEPSAALLMAAAACAAIIARSRHTRAA